jgi:hypothetical protein
MPRACAARPRYRWVGCIPLVLLLILGGVREVQAETPAPGVSAGLDGTRLLIGPVGGAIRLGHSWDSGFGGALALVRNRERAGLALVGAEMGGIRVARDERWLVWGDLLVGSRRLAGLLLGLGAGVRAELSPVFSPRWGSQASFWVFAGITPYARIGAVQRGGTYVDFGIKVPLSAFRF